MSTPYEALRRELRQYEKIAVRKTPTNAFLGYEPIFIQWVKDVLVTLRDEEAPRRAQLEVAAALRLLSIGSDAFFLQACRHIEIALQRSRDAAEDSERTVKRAGKRGRTTDSERLWIVTRSCLFARVAPKCAPCTRWRSRADRVLEDALDLPRIHAALLGFQDRDPSEGSRVSSRIVSP
jgi:hypothetical protein